MQFNTISIRPFIGAQNFEESRSFYRDLGFEETILSADMSVFKTGAMSFYLQNAYVKDWIDNSMIFMEVDDVDRCWNELLALDLSSKYKTVRLTPIKKYDQLIHSITLPKMSNIIRSINRYATCTSLS